MAVPLKYNWRNLRVRKVATLMTAASVFLVVVIVMAISAFLGGITASLRASGSPDNVIIMAKSATTEAFSGASRDILGTIKAYDGIKTDAAGEKWVSEEFAMSIRPLKKVGVMPFWQMRGVTPMAYKVHDVVRLQAGGAWPDGAGELAVGAGLANTMALPRGASLELAGKTYTVVGIFTAAGSSLENEIWMDLNILRAEFKKDHLTSVLVKLEDRSRVKAFVQALDGETRIAVRARAERDYYAGQNLMAGPIRRAGLVMAVLLGFGAVFGGMNTMFAAVAGRRREIGTLRALGFSRAAILFSFIFESVLIALIGFVPAALLALAMGFYRVANSGGFRATAFNLALPAGGWLTAALVATGMGILGGLLPALLAARMKLIESLRG